jgi:hypothetical protein
MHARLKSSISVALLVLAVPAWADEPAWRPNKCSTMNQQPGGVITLGRPQALPVADAIPAPPSLVLQVRLEAPTPMARAQTTEVPPVPQQPVFPAPGAIPALPDQTPYNCGQVNSNADLGFWSKCGQHLRHCWTDVTGSVGGVFQPAQGRTAFASDHCFDVFASPVSNPFYFEDPRALTEIKPLFIWQRTPSANPYFAGGSNYYAGLQGRVAFTPWLSFVVQKFGWESINPNNVFPDGGTGGSGFSEIHLGPKVTFLRNEVSGTVAAFGLTFEVPVGSSSAFQDTGSLSIRPYFSFAQNFGKTTWGSWNFMNTTGYDQRVDSERTDFFFSSFHLDLDAGNAHVFYPLVELNWIHYTRNGQARDFGFEGGNFVNFGSNGVAGHDELTVALGFRIMPFTQNIQFGLAGEFNVLGNQTGRHLDAFRLTADVIFRY